jgi:hypothetical protein
MPELIWDIVAYARYNFAFFEKPRSAARYEVGAPGGRGRAMERGLRVEPGYLHLG